MSRITGYLTNALQGIERYFEINKLAAVLFGMLLAAWLLKPVSDRKGNRLLLYAAGMSILLLCPVTAAMIMVYQTGFYDYEWSWSMVPVTAVIAYVGTLLLGQIVDKKKCLVAGLGFAGLLLLCGNQGLFQKAEKEEVAGKELAACILQCVEQETDLEKAVVWAPQNIMQNLRRKDGKILLVYGRDMWDEKAGAYDYEVYSEEIIDAYEWLKRILAEVEIAGEFEDALGVLQIISKDGRLDKGAEAAIQAVTAKGANVIILPELAAQCYGEFVEEAADRQNLDTEKFLIEGYTIFLLKEAI